MVLIHYVKNTRNVVEAKKDQHQDDEKQNLKEAHSYILPHVAHDCKVGCLSGLLMSHGDFL